MYARNMETGQLGGERGNSGTTRTPSASSTLLPPSTMRSGKSHRLQSVPMTFSIKCGRKATFKVLSLLLSYLIICPTALSDEKTVFPSEFIGVCLFFMCLFFFFSFSTHHTPTFLSLSLYLS
jgi:hypothetical protein